jgi:hypothetical protein
MMRVRAQDADGDYTFGRGSGNFLANSPAAVAQLVMTNLLLKRGEWFLDQTAGTPWSTEILGYGTAPLYDLAIKQAVLDTQGVSSIASYSSNFNKATRALTVTMTILTAFDPAAVPVNVTL